MEKTMTITDHDHKGGPESGCDCWREKERQNFYGMCWLVLVLVAAIVFSI